MTRSQRAAALSDALALYQGKITILASKCALLGADDYAENVNAVAAAQAKKKEWDDWIAGVTADIGSGTEAEMQGPPVDS